MHAASVESLLLSLASWPGWAGRDRACSGCGGLGNHKLSEELISDLESGPSLGSFGPCSDPHCRALPCAVWV